MANVCGHISLLIIISNLIFLPIPSVCGKVVPEPQDCVAKFSAFNFRSDSFNEYHRYYRNDSVAILPNTGSYTGVDSIREYFLFASKESPYISERSVLKEEAKLKRVDEESGTCIFLTNYLVHTKSDPKYAREATAVYPVMVKIVFDYENNYISRADVHLPIGFLHFFFGEMTNTDQTRNYICDVSASCEDVEDVNTGLSRKECKQKLQELPVLTNGRWADGNDQGCRVLHAALASRNQQHCPHISFEPQEDHKGIIKCQTSKGLTTSDSFDENDMQGFFVFLSHVGIDPDVGWKLLDLPQKTSTLEQVVLGLIVPLVIFFLVVFVVYFNGRDASVTSSIEGNNKKRDESRGPTNDLLKNKAHRLRVIGFLWFGILAVTNGLAVLINWSVFGKNSEHTKDDLLSMNNQVDLRDSYRGPTSHIRQTDPLSLISDDGFRVYAGFIVWITCEISGFGAEVFVHHHFTRVWSEKLEGMWRFAQFIFPLMAVVYIGLAVHHNFLSLLILVPGLWKFGFPESIMLMYLSLYGTNLGRLKRVADFIDGAGTIIHHGAASLLVSMLTVEVYPMTRYLYSSILILVMQHWVVLVNYVSPALYCGIEFVLEYFFQWTMLSSFSDSYNVHWACALPVACVVFAHWLYLIAAAMNTFVEEPEVKGKSNRNMHERGQSMMARNLNQRKPHSHRLSRSFIALQKEELAAMQELADEEFHEV